MKAKSLLFYALTLLPLTGFAGIILDQAMTKEELEATGVSTLNPSQKITLEAWIDRHCTLKTNTNLVGQDLFVSIITSDGKKVTLSDSSTYEIAPEDMPIASSWITSSASITVSNSNDPNYPFKLTNTLTKQDIKGKRISS